MRALIQRVSQASVTISGTVKSSIQRGYLILLGVEEPDTAEDVQWLVAKISKLRLFPDAQGLMNQSILDIAGECLVVSQFTLHASTKKGNRPSFIRAARPPQAIPLYTGFCTQLSQALATPVATGEFGATMQVALINDGPVTIWLDSRDRE
jgi:D-aminoacyl-tRNA deacylase